MPSLISLAGESRSGKGTAARIFTEEAHKLGLLVRERQLSGPGKQYLAKAWHPAISEDEAIAWWEHLKVGRLQTRVEVTVDGDGYSRSPEGSVPLQQYMQRMLQGVRTLFGEDAWTDRIIPFSDDWMLSFRVPENPWPPADLCLISDLRQANEAGRVLELGGYSIEMVRPDNDGDAYRTGKDHITEQGLPDYLVNLRIYNTGTYEELECQLRRIFHSNILPRIKR